MSKSTSGSLVLGFSTTTSLTQGTYATSTFSCPKATPATTGANGIQFNPSIDQQALGFSAESITTAGVVTFSCVYSIVVTQEGPFTTVSEMLVTPSPSRNGTNPAANDGFSAGKVAGILGSNHWLHYEAVLPHHCNTYAVCHRIPVPVSGPRIRAMDLATQATYAYVMYMPCPGPLHRTCTEPASA
ncbi:hypothetical protein N658DRAFT_489700 [Parathielavia hyrcaniae]|uniref:Uncharacterized protein n=1 Tax=Parathielavia hyrcaniae TaxID=113614 RepID=A0AAN6PWT0_9PEZI|nr:hypothetical protein N658DRAFT_489700 [Parathielavia hyrcaniae]